MFRVLEAVTNGAASEPVRKWYIGSPCEVCGKKRGECMQKFVDFLIVNGS